MLVGTVRERKAQEYGLALADAGFEKAHNASAAIRRATHMRAGRCLSPEVAAEFGLDLANE